MFRKSGFHFQLNNQKNYIVNVETIESKTICAKTFKFVFFSKKKKQEENPVTGIEANITTVEHYYS